MCLIVDANAASRFLAQPSAIIDWLLGNRGEPRLVAAGKLREELSVIGEVRRLLVRLEQAGRLRSADATHLHREQTRLRSAGHCTSNDHHVLALAIVSGARTLATHDDPLTADFRNPAIIANPRGRVYRDPQNHRKLLGHTPSCGIRPADRPRRRRS